MKWEDNIKEALENRTIKSSDASWAALADRLDAADKTKNKTSFWWMGIAATVVGILFAVTVFFNANPTDIRKPVIVDTQQQVKDPILPMEQAPPQYQLVETHQDVESVEPFEKESANKKPEKKQKIVMPTTKQNLTIAKNQKKETYEPLEIIPQKETLEDKKVSEIVAQINDLKSKGQTITDADIDALLFQAQKEIAFQTILKDGTITVNASALLQDVETDLQQSFRNKIFEALKSSYETVKTAVAERNN